MSFFSKINKHYQVKAAVLRDEDTFDTKVGMIFDDAKLDKMKAPKGHDSGRWEADDKTLKQLQAFVKANPKLHIVTHTSEGDDMPKGGITYSNSVRVVNRLAYYLADGDANPKISLEIDFGQDTYKAT